MQAGALVRAESLHYAAVRCITAPAYPNARLAPGKYRDDRAERLESARRFFEEAIRFQVETNLPSNASSPRSISLLVTFIRSRLLVPFRRRSAIARNIWSRTKRARLRPIRW